MDELHGASIRALLGVLAGFANSDDLSSGAFHRGGHDVADQSCSQASSISLRSRSGFARPYIAAFSCLTRLTVPSTAPEL